MSKKKKVDDKLLEFLHHKVRIAVEWAVEGKKIRLQLCPEVESFNFFWTYIYVIYGLGITWG